MPDEVSGEINFTGSNSNNNLQNKINSILPYAIKVKDNKLSLDKEKSIKMSASQDVKLLPEPSSFINDSMNLRIQIMGLK